jgi:hypothetical protein
VQHDRQQHEDPENPQEGFTRQDRVENRAKKTGVTVEVLVTSEQLQVAKHVHEQEED